MQIVHLKRFQLLHGRWVKSHKIVKFPFENFDPTDYLARVPRQTILEARKEKVTSCNKCLKSGVKCPEEEQSTKDGLGHLDHNENSCCVGSGQSSNQNNQSVPSQNKLNCDYSLTNNSSHDSSGIVCNGTNNHDSVQSELTSDLQDFHQHWLLQDVDPFSLKYKLYALAVSIVNFYL